MELTLWKVPVGQQYIVKRLETEDEEMNGFLFSLGCYEGEAVTVISRRGLTCTVAIKNARYSIDAALAQAIFVE